MGDSVEVGIAIGLHPCGDNPCSQMQAIFIEPLLYVGPYNPQYHEIGLQPYQNFTVTVPEYTLPGPPQEVSLNVAHFALVSVCPGSTTHPPQTDSRPWHLQAGWQPFVEVRNVTLCLVA